MSEPENTDDFDLVSNDPAAWYPLPQAILDDPQLRHAEKARLLAEWARDLVDRSAAADEGMIPEAAGLGDRDVKMQDRIIAAEAALADSSAGDDALSLPQRLWRRVTAAVQGSAEAKVTE